MSSFISWFVFFHSQHINELFICVTLTGLPICVIPKGIGYLEKSCAYCTCQTSLCPKAALSPVIGLSVNACRADRVCDCRASARSRCPQPSPAPAPCQGSCLLGLDVAAGDPRRIQTTSLLGRHLSVWLCIQRSGEIKTLTCRCWKCGTNPSHFLGILNEERNCWENMKNNICFSTHFVSNAAL